VGGVFDHARQFPLCPNRRIAVHTIILISAGRTGTGIVCQRRCERDHRDRPKACPVDGGIGWIVLSDIGCFVRSRGWITGMPIGEGHPSVQRACIAHHAESRSYPDAGTSTAGYRMVAILTTRGADAAPRVVRIPTTRPGVPDISRTRA
jgi:hypothetical protein